MRKLLVVCFIVAWCSNIYAQNSPLVFPAELDSAKVDSFFIVRGIDLHQSNNPELYFEVYRWYRTCYRYGGDTNKGIDCSGFVNMLYEKIYGRKLNSSSAGIYTQCKPVKGGIANAREGDLLFFKIKKKRISHVGIYLQNGKFAHASTQLGVVISNLDEKYYRKHFYKAGVVE